MNNILGDLGGHLEDIRIKFPLADMVVGSTTMDKSRFLGNTQLAVTTSSTNFSCSELEVPVL